MLRFAYFYRKELDDLKESLVHDLRRILYFNQACMIDFTSLPIDQTTENQIQCVSVNSNRKLCGFFGAVRNRDINGIREIYVINFVENSIQFASDFYRFMWMLDHRYGFDKCNFSVVTGTDQEKMYDKYVAKRGGRVVGVFKNHVRLLNGEIRDVKYYEVTRDEIKWD